MRSRQSRFLISSGLIFLAVVAAALQAATVSRGESNPIQIIGDYRYAAHEPETAADAKDHACREALRLAVSTAPPVREQTISPVDSTFTRELVQTLATQHVTDTQIIEYSQKGRTFYCKVKGTLQPDLVQQVAHAQFKANGPEAGTLDRNRVLQLMAVEEQDGMIVVTYKTLKRLDWSSTAYDGSLQGLADVMVDFYDQEGILIATHRHPARRTLTGEDVMSPGQIGILKVPRPLRAKTYRVWLVK